MWGLWEVIKWVWNPHNKINTLIKESPQSFLATSVRLEYDKAPTTRKRAVTWPCWHSDVRTPAPRTVRNKFLLLRSYGLCERSSNVQDTESGWRSFPSSGRNEVQIARTHQSMLHVPQDILTSNWFPWYFLSLHPEGHSLAHLGLFY